MTARVRSALYVAALVVASLTTAAHDGPPFPILSNQIAGPYLVSIWTDPDTTDDGSPGGQFWVRLHLAGTEAPVPPRTRATITIRPLDPSGAERSVSAVPVRDDVTNQFGALVMDREGRFRVHVAIDGPPGSAVVDAAVDATYDMRPAPSLLILYLAPFLLAGLLWGRLLVRRRGIRRPVDTGPRAAS
jgi:hypothetical protein